MMNGEGEVKNGDVLLDEPSFQDIFRVSGDGRRVGIEERVKTR